MTELAGLNLTKFLSSKLLGPTYIPGTPGWIVQSLPLMLSIRTEPTGLTYQVGGREQSSKLAWHAIISKKPQMKWVALEGTISGGWKI